MNKPNFQIISLKELRAYVLSNREDDEVFYIFVDRIHVEKNWKTYPPLKSMEDMENYPKVIEKMRKDSGRKVDFGNEC